MRLRVALVAREHKSPSAITAHFRAHIRLLGTFGDSGSFRGFAPFSCPEERSENRVVPEGRFLHSPCGGSFVLDFTKYGQEPTLTENNPQTSRGTHIVCE